MKRKIIDALIEWRNQAENNSKRKPILLLGAKGVGKTYLAYDFAKSFFDQIIYLNFEQDRNLVKRFHQQLLLDRKEELSDNRILILDEIPPLQDLMNTIFHIQNTGIYPYIIAISSNPILEDWKSGFQSIPVYPLEFDEFLTATGNEWYIEVIMQHYLTNVKIPEIVHNELLTLHKLYLQIGGMPAAINEYINMSSLINVPEQHQGLFSSYLRDIELGSNESDALKMKQVLNTIPLQLLKDNKKFQYKIIRKGTTHTMYKDAIHTLAEKNYVIKCNRIANSDFNNTGNNKLTNTYDLSELLQSSEETNTNFKLYLSDVGLLSTRIANEICAEDIDKIKIIHRKNKDKAILENYVAQALLARNYHFGFWESDSMAKIDFLIQKENSIIPIEIHCNDITRSKSISVFKQKCDIPYAIKISSKNFDFKNQIKYIPYYATFCI